MALAYDHFDGPNCRQLIQWARERSDHRAPRLLGVDDHLQARANSGFQESDERRWEKWKQEDREALTEVATENGCAQPFS